MKIGVLGAGKIVEDAHLPVLRNFADVEIAWVTDVNRDRSQFLNRTYGVKSIEIESFSEAIEAVDVCLIAIPFGVRQPYIEVCSEKSIAVYVEKPFARRREEHERLCSLFPEYKLGVGFQRRCYASTRAISEVISTCAFGKLERVDFNFGQYSLKSGGSGRYITQKGMAGGGMIFESAVHGLDQILFATAAESVEVQQARSVVYDGIDYDTTVSSIVITNGNKVPVECNLSTLQNLSQTFSYQFENAVVSFGLQPNSPLTVRAHSTADESTFEASSPGASSVSQSFYMFWQRFFEALKTTVPNETSAPNSLLTTSWLEDIYRKIGCD